MLPGLCFFHLTRFHPMGWLMHDDSLFIYGVITSNGSFDCYGFVRRLTRFSSMVVLLCDSLLISDVAIWLGSFKISGLIFSLTR